MESTIYIIIQTKDCPCSITIQTFYLKDEKKKKIPGICNFKAYHSEAQDCCGKV